MLTAPPMGCLILILEYVPVSASLGTLIACCNKLCGCRGITLLNDIVLDFEVFDQTGSNMSDRTSLESSVHNLPYVIICSLVTSQD